MFKKILFLFIIIIFSTRIYAQVEGTEKKYIRIGKLQSLFSAYGSERAWNNSYYEGMVWPADYPYTDNAVIKRTWIAARDFTDDAGKHWDHYGIYFALGYVGQSLFPIELKETAKFEPPIVYVDGNNITAPYLGDVDEVDPNQIADRIVTNVVNTSMGLTMTRKIYAFSQQYHDNYFIKEFIFTNTGNTDYDDDIELNDTLRGVRISWGVRYSVSRDGGMKIGDGQVWGKHTWVTKRGEDYKQHYNEQLTEADGPVDWIRCGFAWAGQSAKNSYDNIGGPDVRNYGRLASPQFAGIAVLHVDKSYDDKSDNPDQPLVLGWHAGDTYPKLGDMTDASKMDELYDMLSGNPYKKLGGNERFYEIYHEDHPDPYTVHMDGGGTNIWIVYGPFDIPPGESIRIVEAEGVSGLSRELCEIIGRRWKEAYANSSDKGPFQLPDGSTTDDKDIFKNSWVYTGIDSILLTFSRAKRNFDLNFNIPQPPLPPSVFEVKSGGDRISLTWNLSESESDPDFGGYKIFRAVGKPDTVYTEIADLPKGTTFFDDMSAIRGFSYYYYIVSYLKGENNSDGVANPDGILMSNKFYTRTTEPAYLRRMAGTSLEGIRIVPNPYNIKAQKIQFPGEPNKLMFLNIPGHCVIKIYTVRGDLIYTIHHEDGSGDESWNLVSSSRQTVVSGVYIAHFEVTEDFKDPETGKIKYKKGDTIVKKFIVIR